MYELAPNVVQNEFHFSWIVDILDWEFSVQIEVENKKKMEWKIEKSVAKR